MSDASKITEATNKRIQLLEMLLGLAGIIALLAGSPLTGMCLLGMNGSVGLLRTHALRQNPRILDGFLVGCALFYLLTV